MGVEIVGVLIFPITLISLAFALWFWFAVVKAKYSTAIGYVSGYMPLIGGFAVSMTGLALRAYIDSAAYFTWLVEHDYYTESQRPVYLPGRVVGQAVVDLVFVLPALCFIVIPCTARLIRTRRLTLSAIALRATIGWVALSLVATLALSFFPLRSPVFWK